MRKKIFCIAFLFLFFIGSVGYAETVVFEKQVKTSSSKKSGKNRILLAAKKKKKKKQQKKRGGFVSFENPYGDSSEWAEISLYSKPNFAGEQWTIEIYGSALTIKDNTGNKKKRVKNNFFKSAKIAFSTGGAVYFYDDNNFNKKKEGNYGWVFLPSNHPILEIKSFDKENTSKNISNPYYKISKAEKGKKLGGEISSLKIMFSKMR